MAQPVPIRERIRRQLFMEELVDQGYSPLGVVGEMPSAAQEGKRRDGVNYSRWIRDEQKILANGQKHYLPVWMKVEGETVPASVLTPVSPFDHAETRATALSTSVSSLITSSRYPVVNPDAILISSHLTQRYDRKSGSHVMSEATPRTWLTDTLRVAPIPDNRNRKFLFTGAQNDAPLHEGFWANLNAYASWLGAEVIVGPWTYATSWWSETNPKSRSYAKPLADHLCFGQMAIGDNFVFCGEMNTLPTANQPISDLLTYSRNRWAVFPHAKRQLKSVPSTDPEVQAHQVMTTGSVTKPMVAPRKAGVKSLFHHVIGAVIVEFDEYGNPFCRQITANKSGAFYDLDRYVTDESITEGHRIRALVCGDIHTRKLDRANSLATFGIDISKDLPHHVGKNSIVPIELKSDVLNGTNRFNLNPHVSVSYHGSVIEKLDPMEIILHDLFDHETRNHHSASDNGHALVMHEQGKDHIIDEILQAAGFLEVLNKSGRKIVVVESNHDIGLNRYISEGRYRFDAPNIKIGLRLETAYLEHRSRVGAALSIGAKPPKFSLLEYAIRETCFDIPCTSWAYDGYSYLVDGIECGHHGFRGANGAKGTVQGFANTGRKMTVADKHSPEICEGVYVAGCMNLRQEYNKGMSSWAIAHVVQYADGNRSIITLQNGRWSANKPRVTVRV